VKIEEVGRESKQRVKGHVVKKKGAGTKADNNRNSKASTTGATLPEETGGQIWLGEEKLPNSGAPREPKGEAGKNPPNPPRPT